MAKKTKLNLEELEVQSFVTSLPDESKTLAKGGAEETYYCSDPCVITAIWDCSATCEGYTCGPCC